MRSGGLDGGRGGVEIVDDQRIGERAELGLDPARGGEVELLEARREQLAAELVAQPEQLGIEGRAAALDDGRAMLQLGRRCSSCVRCSASACASAASRSRRARELAARGDRAEACGDRPCVVAARDAIVDGGEPAAELGLARVPRGCGGATGLGAGVDLAERLFGRLEGGEDVVGDAEIGGEAADDRLAAGEAECVGELAIEIGGDAPLAFGEPGECCAGERVRVAGRSPRSSACSAVMARA